MSLNEMTSYARLLYPKYKSYTQKGNFKKIRKMDRFMFQLAPIREIEKEK